MSSTKMAAAVGFCLASVLAAGSACAQVKVGAVLSVTGPASFLGDPEKRTLELYVDEINAKGGVNGQKLQLVVYDDGADANAARTFATRLIEEDKVVAMVGGTTTGATVNQRKMASGATNTLNYQLYSDAARSTIWGNTTGTDTVTGVGTGLAQSLTVYGSIPAAQASPAGDYQDVITVTVFY